jgi:hypothetical protein
VVPAVRHVKAGVTGRRQLGLHRLVVEVCGVEIVGQVQNSAPGVSPATSIQYGYVSYLRGLSVFSGVPSETSAL